MVSEFTGRLVLVAIVGGAASVVAGNYSTGTEQLVDPKDGWRCATMYVLAVNHDMCPQKRDILTRATQIFWVYDGGCYVYSLIAALFGCFFW